MGASASLANSPRSMKSSRRHSIFQQKGLLGVKLEEKEGMTNDEIFRMILDFMENLKKSVIQGMETYLKSLENPFLLKKYHELQSKLEGGAYRIQYLNILEDIFNIADDNENRLIEDFEIYNLIKYYFDEHGFQLSDELIKRLICDYICIIYDMNGEIRLKLEEFIDFVDRVNTTMIAPAYEEELKCRQIGYCCPSNNNSIAD